LKEGVDEMKGETVEMSRKELSRLEVLEKLSSKQISQVSAAEQLGLSERQVRRLQARYRRQGAEGLASCRRGKPSNHQLSEEVKSEAMEIIESRYKDFGPTLAHEKLVENHQLNLSVESVRQLMMKKGFWKGKTRQKIVIHQQRKRRSSVGELVQIDGSPHDWFEDRGGRCCLLAWVDDATSQLLHLRFEEVETTAGYLRGMKDYLKKHGRPVCLYSDRHGIFRQNQGSDLKEQADPQFTRAMKELGIELICANSPQAKGRVERANGILQDRLVKELRLKGISDMAAANAFLPEFIEDYNRRFAVEPRNSEDSHQRTLPTEEALDFIFSFQAYRKLSKNLELSYQNVIYQIQSDQPGYRLRKAIVQVRENLEGVVTLWLDGKSLPYMTMTKHQRRTDILNSKEKDHRVDKIIQERQSQYKSTPNHPWKKAGALAIARQNKTLKRV
jgi:transposase